MSTSRKYMLLCTDHNTVSVALGLILRTFDAIPGSIPIRTNLGNESFNIRSDQVVVCVSMGNVPRTIIVLFYSFLKSAVPRLVHSRSLRPVNRFGYLYYN